MTAKPTYKELQQRIAVLEKDLKKSQRFEKINSTLSEISAAISTTSSLDELYKTIHLSLSSIIDTTNFYIASYDKVQDSVTFPYIVDTVDGSYPPVINISQKASLTAEVIRTGSPLMITKAEVLTQRDESGLEIPGCTPAEIWLGVPLKYLRKIVGVMTVQSYTNPLCYDQTDMKVMVAVADQVAIAIERKRADSALKESESRFRKLLQEIPSVAVQGYTLDGTTRFWNKASERLYGYSAQEAIGKNLLDLIIPMKMRDEVQGAIQWMAKTGKAIAASELSLMHKDGSPVAVFSSHAMVEMPGKEREFFCIDIDISERKQFEEAFQISVTQLQSVFRAAPVGIGVVSDRVFIQVNEKLCEMTGYTRDELIDQRSKMLYENTASYEYVGNEKYRQIQLYGTGTVETRWQKKDGTLIDVLLSSTPLDAADLSQGVTFTALDITARKQTEKALLERESYFRALFENAGDAIFIEDEQDRIIDVNRQACELLGYTREELLQMYIPDLQAPEYRGSRGSTIRNELAHNNGVPFESVDIMKDGTPVPVEVTTVQLHTGSDNLALSIVRNITERKRSEADKERLIQAIEQSGETIMITDPQGVIQYVNPTFTTVTGYSLEEVIGKKPDILKSGTHDVDFYRDLWKTASSGKTWKGQITNRKKDGSLFTEEVTISPVMDADEKIVNYIAVKLDITEKLEAEKDRLLLENSLNQAQKMESVGRLAGGVAHDFNNMLGVILGHAEMALDEIEPNDPVFTNLQEICDTTERSADITRQLLAFARKQMISPKVIDLNETVAGMLKMLLRLIGENINLSWLPGSGLWPVKVDPAQIDQILANLCVNARDAIADVGKIVVETTNCILDEEYCHTHAGFKPGQYVRIDVSDNGSGIEQETLAHVFEPFFTTKDIGKGTGLGLATVYGIVKQNNGFINIYSESGQGTRLTIYLPRYLGPEERETAESEAAPQVSGGETILLVEDEPALLIMTRKMLERLGYVVLPSASPSEAIRVESEYTEMIDLLISDVIMPEMNGQNLAKQLLANRPEMKCLFMSGYTSNIISSLGVLQDDVNFIQKPFSRIDLATKIRTVLSVV